MLEKLSKLCLQVDQCTGTVNRWDPVRRRSHKSIAWYKSFLYKAASWKKARRVVAKVQHNVGE